MKTCEVCGQPIRRTEGEEFAILGTEEWLHQESGSFLCPGAIGVARPRTTLLDVLVWAFIVAVLTALACLAV